ncbi:pyrroline-5-carboxylate reductase 3 isoform X1 [Engystomops pustulosus]|uniref:pyrroline-5-carboxylate reductase 3 isoform X1 n=1 Tax=Engystomops pustulosus TaxID=76066 RepID=UPI003AFA7455
MMAAAGSGSGSDPGTGASSDLRVGCIGAGKMARGVLGGLIISGKVPVQNITVSAPSDSNLQQFRAQGCSTTHSNISVVQQCDLLFLATKPPLIPQVLVEISSAITARHVIVSMAAGVSLRTLEKVEMLRSQPELRPGCAVAAALDVTRECCVLSWCPGGPHSPDGTEPAVCGAGGGGGLLSGVLCRAGGGRDAAGSALRVRNVRGNARGLHRRPHRAQRERRRLRLPVCGGPGGWGGEDGDAQCRVQPHCCPDPAGSSEDDAGDGRAPSKAALRCLHPRRDHHTRPARAGEGRPQSRRHERRGSRHQEGARDGQELEAAAMTVRDIPGGGRV